VEKAAPSEDDEADAAGRWTPGAVATRGRLVQRADVLDSEARGSHTVLIMPIATEDQFRALYGELVLEFVAELMNATQGATTDRAFQRAVQAYVDELRPWLSEQDAPVAPRPVFSLFTSCEFSEKAEDVSVVLSPEGEALFRAWVRRQAVVCATARGQDPGWEQ